MSFGPLPGGEYDIDSGKAAVLAGEFREIKNNGRLTLSELKAGGNTVTGKFDFQDDETIANGFAPFTGDFEGVAEGGKIKSIKATADAKTQQALAAVFGPRPPRERKTLVGSGHDTEVIQAFLPSSLTVRAGDTVTWMLDSDEAHTVSFLSGAPYPPSRFLYEAAFPPTR